MTAAHSHKHHAGHSHPAHSHTQNSQAIWRAIYITLFFMAVEFIGGWLSNSLALLTDAAHMLTDIGAMLLSLFALWVARRPVTATMSFGYHRAEILGALTSGLMIWLISGLLIYEAFVRMQNPPEVQGPTVLVIATLGLIANLASMWGLHNVRHQNINIRATYLHMLSDCLGSIGAIIAGAVIWATDWRPIDPIMTLIFSVLMLITSWALVRDAVRILMESTPHHLNPREIQRELETIPGVLESHDLHIWSVTSGKAAMSVHLISKDPSQDLLGTANALLKEKYGIVHTTIQIEHPDRFQSERCYDCSPA